MSESTMVKSVETLKNLIAAKKWDEVRSELADYHVSDIAELIIELPTEQEGIVFRVLPRDPAGQVLSYLPFEHQHHLLYSLSKAQMVALVAGLPSDDRTPLYEGLPAA